jgi:K+/H+ antiporter YhaU regulatory subunit KhtT
VITNEVEDSVIDTQPKLKKSNNVVKFENTEEEIVDNGDQINPLFQPESNWDKELELGISRGLSAIPEVHSDIGETKESLLQADFADKQRYINRLQDTIRGMAIEESIDGIMTTRKGESSVTAPPKIVAVTDKDDHQLVLVGVNACDRPGLLLDISKSLIRLGLNFHRTEALVLDGRSLSLWRCEVLEEGVSDIEEIWSVLNAMLEINSGVEALKSRGIRVIRAIVPKQSSLVGVTASDINFRDKYKCAIIAIQRDGSSPAGRLAQTKFVIGDVLVLQTNDDSPLLVPPPKDFYKSKGNKGMSRSTSNSSITRFVRKRFGSFSSLESLQTNEDQDVNQPGDISSLQNIETQEGHKFESDSVNSAGNNPDEADRYCMKEKVGACFYFDCCWFPCIFTHLLLF